jgi:hypothetical protein
LLESLFVAELLLPSPCLWLISPWLTDLELLDNRSGAFASLDPQWGPRRIRVVEILGRLLEVGSHIVVATRPGQHNDTFVRKLDDLSRASGVADRLTVHRSETLHLKGILGRDFYLSGSMNLTFNGVEILEEGVTLETSPEALGTARIQLLHSYGGVT